MSTARAPQGPSYLEKLQPIIDRIVGPAAAEIDRSGSFPSEALKALGDEGLLGLISSPEVGGLGESHRAAAAVVEKLSEACSSTAMVVCMHYCGTAVIEAHGESTLRHAIADGSHLTTLAFSEAGSRSHFWAPVSSAVARGEQVILNAKKSWATSAGQADSYVWSSRPLEAEGNSTLWLVPASTKGLTVGSAFDGLGLRGNYSSPVMAEDAVVSRNAMLGPDGGGFDLMMGTILPYFQIMNASTSLGLMEAATQKTVQHLVRTRMEHLDQTLADFPTLRAYAARMRIKTDMTRALIRDTVDSLESGRDDAMLRVLEVKAAAGESATEVSELAMRICGGAAYRKEVGVERNFRDARAATVMAPTTDALYDFIGKAISGLPLFG